MILFETKTMRLKCLFKIEIKNDIKIVFKDLLNIIYIYIIIEENNGVK